MHIDSPHIKKLLRERVVAIVGAVVIAEFNKYLCTLRWFPTSLDWRGMPPWEQFRLAVDNEAAAVEWAHRMAIGKHSHVVAVYKWDEPGLVCTLDAAIFNLGALFAHAPGKNFFFGADQEGDSWRYKFADLMEFDGGEVFTAVR
jgi:hypothetical protein